MRYCWVSAANVSVSLSVFTICYNLFKWPAVVSNLSAWMFSTMLAYLLSKFWVWKQHEFDHLGKEILMFWVMAFAGLALSSSAVWVIQLYTTETVYLLIGYLSVYGIMWIVKYFFCDRLIWPAGADG